MAGTTAMAETKSRVVIYDDVATKVAAAPDASKDLWLSIGDLTKSTKLEIKPEGVCAGKLCFPIPPMRRNEFLAQHDDTTWFNLSAFARLLQMPIATDPKHSLWCFGQRPQEHDGYLTTLVAPDFSLPDLEGRNHSLKDFRGKKVLLLTWASW
jgi:hypothetical protein